MRACYRFLLWLHPPVFRREFAGEMLWIFDQAADTQGALPFFRDGVGSLLRQWLLRSGWWKIALALSLAVLEMILGGLGALIFGRNRIVVPVSAPAVSRVAGFAHQSLTLGMLMFLTVFLVGGLTILIIGLTFWSKRVR